jgi:hypothetical protein
VSRPKTLKSQKRRAWALLSEYIRKKYSDEYGMCQCYTCSTRLDYREMQAGHGVSGRTNWLLTLEAEELIRPQCMPCNILKGGQYEIFIPKLIDEYTLEGFQDFVIEARKPLKMRMSDWGDQIEQIQDRLHELDN